MRVIEHENPDLICLQEVTRHARRTLHDDQPGILSTRFSAVAHLYQLTVHYRVGGYGNLILSRWPVTESHHICLRRGRWKPRGVQIAVVQTPDGPIHLANWHLGLGESERHWQVDKLLHHPRFREAIRHPTLIVGDCNDWRNRLATAALTEHGFEEATKPASRFRSFPAFLSVLALDKAFHKNGVRVTDARVVRSPLARRASDHLPLVVDFHLG
jgi:endonuclease/exonuclease/phosphatase family metal-dependent hydrolase